MKYFLIISIVCTVWVHAAWGEESKTYMEMSGPELSRKIIKECSSELNVPAYYEPHGIYLAFELLTYIYPGPKTGKMICMAACAQRKVAEMQGYTLHTYVKKNIDLVYESGHGSPKVTADELKSKVDNCFMKERNGCEFYKCLEILKPPFSHVLASLLKPKLLDTIHSVFH